MANNKSNTTTNFNALYLCVHNGLVLLYNDETETTNIKLLVVSPDWIIPICSLMETHGIKTIEIEGEVDDDFVEYCNKKGVAVCQR